MFVEHKEVGEEQKVGMSKPSCALRLGAMIRPQGREAWFVEGRSCALGAISEALFGDTRTDGDRLYARFPELTKKDFAPPVTVADAPPPAEPKKQAGGSA